MAAGLLVGGRGIFHPIQRPPDITVDVWQKIIQPAEAAKALANKLFEGNANFSKDQQIKSTVTILQKALPSLKKRFNKEHCGGQHFISICQNLCEVLLHGKNLREEVSRRSPVMETLAESLDKCLGHMTALEVDIRFPAEWIQKWLRARVDHLLGLLPATLCDSDGSQFELLVTTMFGTGGPRGSPVDYLTVDALAFAFQSACVSPSALTTKLRAEVQSSLLSHVLMRLVTMAGKAAGADEAHVMSALYIFLEKVACHEKDFDTWGDLSVKEACRTDGRVGFVCREWLRRLHRLTVSVHCTEESTTV